ncbi:hypothetical protein FXN61_32210 [Lentzea sp. PSKA42]|uniref:Secreted protein n=1 Tax=Lentzea indica TaxID=2604800 RepID=A0ABX1FQA8_9PSEU|nr:hypothetical protein [Lentzea indica]NKE61188.1 hypothetical protein [Lentzea indica]
MKKTLFGLMTAVLLTGVTAAPAASANDEACGLRAFVPVRSGDNVVARGVREDCADYANVRITLVKVVKLNNVPVVWRELNLRTGNFDISASCRQQGAFNYYSHVEYVNGGGFWTSPYSQPCGRPL